MKFCSFIFSITLWLWIILGSANAQVLDRDFDDAGGIILQNQKEVPVTKRHIIHIAVILPLSGDAQGTGERLKQSLPIIKELTNSIKYDAAFGSKFEINLIVKDGACNSQSAKQVAQQIVASKKIFFVIGHYCSAATVAALPIYNKAGIIVISPFSTETSITERGFMTFFRLAGRTDRFGEFAADWLNEFRGRFKLATIYGDPVFGRALVKNVIIGLELRDQRSGTYLDNYYKKSYDLSLYRDNLSLLIQRLKQDNVKLIYYGGYYTGLADFVKEARQQNVKFTILSNSSAQNYDFWVRSEGAAAGVLFTFIKDITRDIADQDINKIKRRRDFKRLQAEINLEEAIRTYGIENSRSFIKSNRIYRDRVTFIREYFLKYQEFPDAYMAGIFASIEIFKDIILNPDYTDFFTNDRPKTFQEMRVFGFDVADYMHDKGFESNEQFVGFATILGAVNFSNTGDWKNPEYVIYQWINKYQDRNWITENPQEIDQFIGPKGDFLRLF